MGVLPPQGEAGRARHTRPAGLQSPAVTGGPVADRIQQDRQRPETAVMLPFAARVSCHDLPASLFIVSNSG